MYLGCVHVRVYPVVLWVAPPRGVEDEEGEGRPGHIAEGQQQKKPGFVQRNLFLHITLIVPYYRLKYSLSSRNICPYNPILIETMEKCTKILEITLANFSNFRIVGMRVAKRPTRTCECWFS